MSRRMKYWTNCNLSTFFLLMHFFVAKIKTGNLQLRWQTIVTLESCRRLLFCASLTFRAMRPSKDSLNQILPFQQIMDPILIPLVLLEKQFVHFKDFQNFHTETEGITQFHKFKLTPSTESSNPLPFNNLQLQAYNTSCRTCFKNSYFPKIYLSFPCELNYTVHCFHLPI